MDRTNGQTEKADFPPDKWGISPMDGRTARRYKIAFRCDLYLQTAGRFLLVGAPD
jgi:hypothetical protein